MSFRANQRTALTRAYTPTAHDTNPVEHAPTELWVGGAGNVKVTTVDGDTITLTAVPAGTRLTDIRVRQLWSTGTTATLIVGFY